MSFQVGFRIKIKLDVHNNLYIKENKKKFRTSKTRSYVHQILVLLKNLCTDNDAKVYELWNINVR